MIRRDAFKYIASSEDGEMLFNLESDPEERSNLIDAPDQAETLARFRDELRQKWNEETLIRDIKLSQQRRILVRAAMNQGTKRLWNHDEDENSKVIWYRGEQGYNEWAFDYI